jgi:hypothetical protein
MQLRSCFASIPLGWNTNLQSVFFNTTTFYTYSILGPIKYSLQCKILLAPCWGDIVISSLFVEAGCGTQRPGVHGIILFSSFFSNGM